MTVAQAIQRLHATGNVDIGQLLQLVGATLSEDMSNGAGRVYRLCDGSQVEVHTICLARSSDHHGRTAGTLYEWKLRAYGE